MRQSRLSGSVEGVMGNHDSYSDPPLRLGIEPGAGKMKRISRGWKATIAESRRGDVMDRQSGAGVRRRTSDFGL